MNASSSEWGTSGMALLKYSAIWQIKRKSCSVVCEATGVQDHCVGGRRGGVWQVGGLVDDQGRGDGGNDRGRATGPHEAAGGRRLAPLSGAVGGKRRGPHDGLVGGWILGRKKLLSAPRGTRLGLRGYCTNRVPQHSWSRSQGDWSSHTAVAGSNRQHNCSTAAPLSATESKREPHACALHDNHPARTPNDRPSGPHRSPGKTRAPPLTPPKPSTPNPQPTCCP
jgi:hypothetical protein